ncbi:hypothetical protein T484DRAFT_1938673 [Baffinella frigidus]|nr:hypothetical protein T484DRAFT_1938673 [Cryptophyta sp. CCMP2293]
MARHLEDLQAGSAIGLDPPPRKRGCELETPEEGDWESQRVVRPRLAETWFRPLEVAALHVEASAPQDEVADRALDMSCGDELCNAFEVLMKPRKAPREEDQDLLACRICRCSKAVAASACAHCTKTTCTRCVVKCAVCDHSFCSPCSTINYDQREERTLCLGCQLGR